MKTLALAAAALLTAAPLLAHTPDPAHATWVELAPLPEPRTEAVAVAAAGELWVLGGIFPGAGGVRADGRVDAYDPAADAWREAPPLPLPVHHSGAVAVGDRIVVTGGFLGGWVDAPQFVAVADAWVLDASLPAHEQAWAELPSLPLPRGGHTAATDGRFVYVYGGVAAAPIYTPEGEKLLEKTAYRLDLDSPSPTWERVADFPDPRDHLTAAWVDGTAYAIGGRDLGLHKNTVRVDAYDPATDAWSRAPDMPTARGGIGAAVVDGSVIVVGGEARRQAFDTVEVLDAAARAWSTGPSLPEPRHGVGVAAIDGTVYVAGGGPVQGFSYSDSLYAWAPR